MSNYFFPLGRQAFSSIVISLILLTSPVSAHAADTGLLAGVGLPGATFANGAPHYVDETTGEISIHSQPGQAHRVDYVPNVGNHLSFLIVAPKAGDPPLHRGYYPGAIPGYSSSAPQFWYYATNGACPHFTSVTDFIVRHIRYEGDEITSLVIDYRIHCGPTDPYFFGTIRINPEKARIDERSFLDFPF